MFHIMTSLPFLRNLCIVVICFYSNRNYRDAKVFFQKGKVHRVDCDVLSIYFPYSKYNGVIAMEHQLYYKGVDAEYLSTYQD